MELVRNHEPNRRNQLKKATMVMTIGSDLIKEGALEEFEKNLEQHLNDMLPEIRIKVILTAVTGPSRFTFSGDVGFTEEAHMQRRTLRMLKKSISLWSQELEGEKNRLSSIKKPNKAHRRRLEEIENQAFSWDNYSKGITREIAVI